jgi:hypothetical protein
MHADETEATRPEVVLKSAWVLPGCLSQKLNTCLPLLSRIPTCPIEINGSHDNDSAGRVAYPEVVADGALASTYAASRLLSRDHH